MTEAATSTVLSLPDHVPARTIREFRRLAPKRLTQEELAASFGVAVRTVIRWEQNGLDPTQLALDPAAVSGPEWRKSLLEWFLTRHAAALSSDTAPLLPDPESTARGRRRSQRRRPPRRAR